MSLFRKEIVASFVVGIALIAGLSATASAHVVVRPSEVVTAGFQTFTIGVPNEKDIQNTTVKLVIPDGLEHVSPTQKAGWTIETEKTGEGESAVVKSITWSGNAVNPGFRDDFTFSAKVPGKETELQWKAYQTYSDGTVVSWDKEGDSEAEGENSGPFSLTKVVSSTQADTSVKNANDKATNAQDLANTSTYIAVSAVVLSLVSIYFATKKRS